MDKENQTENDADAEDGVLEALREENRILGEELEARKVIITGLEGELKARQEEIDTLSRSLEATQAQSDKLEKELTQATAAYRGLAIEANPGVPEELVNGETIEEIGASLANVRTLVEKVRQEVEAEAARARIPAGAPPRVPPDLSGLSAREKIQYAIGGNR